MTQAKQLPPPIPRACCADLVTWARGTRLGPGVAVERLPSKSLGCIFCTFRSQLSQASGFPCWHLSEISRARNPFAFPSFFGARNLRKSLSGHCGLTTDNRTETSATTHNKGYALCKNSSEKLQTDDSSPKQAQTSNP